MRAAVIEAMEQLPVVRDDVPDPAPDRGQVLVEVDAAALNPVELHIWRGRYRDGSPQVPYVPGVEGVGRVVSGGACAPGTRVRFEAVGLHPGYGTHGTLAERAVVPAEIVTPLPDDVEDAPAAALGATGITALRTLETVGVKLGETVLVLGASGMVGRCAVQLAKPLGAARVIAAGRDADALRRAVDLGADAAVALDGPHEEVVAALREAGGDGGINVVVDPLWGPPALAALEAAAVDVRLINIGRAAGDPLELPHPLMLRKRATIRGLSTAMERMEERAAAYRRLLQHVAAGRLTVDHETVALDEVGAAWERLAAGAGRKLVVRVRP